MSPEAVASSRASGRRTRLDARDYLADERELRANAREHLADERELRANERERIADEREAQEDQRTRELAELATALEAAAQECKGSTAQRITLSQETVARTRELLEAVHERVAHAGAARERAIAWDEREIAGIEREIVTSMSASGDGDGVRSDRIAHLQRRADELRGHEQRLRQQAAALDAVRSRRALADSQAHEQLRRAARLRRELASTALAIAEVEDEVAVNLDALAALNSPERARSRLDIAQRAREFAEQERDLSKHYTS